MRPYLEWHSDVDVVFDYIMRPGSEPIGGTIPNLGHADLKKRLRELSSATATPKPFLHLTLSLPVGYRASNKVWRRLVKSALQSLGMDPDAMPWFATRHKDSSCDHVHCVTALQDFSGRDVVVSANREKSEAIHRELCRMTGLPQPEYFDPDAGPRLLPVTPARNLKNAEKKLLHTDLEYVFLHHQPPDLDALNHQLAAQPGAFQGQLAINRHGTQSIVWSNHTAEFFTGELGLGWEPRFVAARLKLARVLRTIRHAIDLHHLKTLFLNPKMEKLLETTIANARQRGIANGREDHPRPAAEDGQERDIPSPTDRAPEPAGGSTRISGGSAGAIAGRTQRNVETAAGTAERDDYPANPLGEYSDKENDGSAGSTNATRQTDHSNPDDLGATPRLTFGALLASVCQVAAKGPPGWRLKVAHVLQMIGIQFADGSGAEVTKEGVQIIEDGDDVRAFEKGFYDVMPELQPETETLDDAYDDGFSM